MLAGFLRDNVISILHKFIAYAIMGKEEANKVNLHELYLLHCATSDIKICAGFYILLTFKNILASPRYHATLPLVIAAIGRHLGVFDPEHIEPQSDIIFCSRIGFSELKNAKIITPDHRWFPADRRTCVQNQVNRLRASNIASASESGRPDLFDDAEYEDAPMPDTQMPDSHNIAMSSAPFSYGAGSSSTDPFASLSADVRSLRQDFGEFRTDFQHFQQEFRDHTSDFRSFRQDFVEFRDDVYQRQDRVERQSQMTHDLVLDHQRQWQLAQERANQQYEQTFDTHQMMNNLSQQWAAWSLQPPHPPPDQQ